MHGYMKPQMEHDELRVMRASLSLWVPKDDNMVDFDRAFLVKWRKANQNKPKLEALFEKYPSLANKKDLFKNWHDFKKSCAAQLRSIPVEKTNAKMMNNLAALVQIATWGSTELFNLVMQVFLF